MKRVVIRIEVIVQGSMNHCLDYWTTYPVDGQYLRLRPIFSSSNTLFSQIVGIIEMI